MGRPKGSRNKDKEDFRQRIRKYCEANNVDPFMYMADLIKKKGVLHQVKLIAAKELAQYLEPKLRSVEISGNEDKPLVMTTPEERAKRIAELEAKRAQRIEPLSLVDPE